jgi:hypothetical protein
LRKIEKQPSISNEQVLISPPSSNLLSSNTEHEFRSRQKSLNTNSDCDEENELSKSRYLSEFDHIRLIGKGGFGLVFEAKHKIDERVFAIKRIRLKNQ